MIRVNNIKLGLDEDIQILKEKAAGMLGIKADDILSWEIAKKAVDARNKSNIQYVYSVRVKTKNEALCKTKNVVFEKEERYSFPTVSQISSSPVIVGAGPAGLFAALVLAQNGYAPILLERGCDVDKRSRDIEIFWNKGILNANSNVQFGEGGAGTFSDGKLTTGIKDMRCRKVLEEFVRFGAPEEILYLSKPHIGTDKLRIVVKNMRDELVRLGTRVYFESKVSYLLLENGRLCGIKVQTKQGFRDIMTDRVILAIGHSARDTFQMLYESGVRMEQKAFSIGARIEHLQEMINKSQYGDFYKKLKAADYKLSVHLPTGRSAYTFCMCPGGQVVAAASEEGCLVTNGLSSYSRDGKNANSALLVGVSPQDFQSDMPLAGIELQRRIEKAAFSAGGGSYRAPAQLVGDFLRARSSTKIGNVEPTYMPGVEMADLRECMPEFIVDTMKSAIWTMDKQLHGFAAYDAVLTGVETRSSSPVRIVRNERFESNIKGLYPCGEGAGYAGGIMSAAVDGIRCAEACIKNY
ncbi:MAG: hypothetical protein N2171_03780 [Clostridia bacterium]|nr:hypothetical protein [Clostridia bacterium]